MSGTPPQLDLQPEYLGIVRDILRIHVPDRKVLAFGSRAAWSAKKYSDLDLAILGDEPLSLDVTSALSEEFEESDLPFKVDLVDWTLIDKAFRNIIHANFVTVQEPVSKFGKPALVTLDWPPVAVGEFSEKVAMGPFGSSIKVETFVPDGVPVISGQHLHGSRLNDTPGYNFIEENHAQRLANANVQRGDIIFTHAGNIGQVSYIPEDSQYERYVISQRQFCMRCDPEKAIPEFVTYYFRSPEGQYKLLANASQVGVPSIAQPVTYLRTIEVPLPPPPEQRAIAHILGTLDKKIELNRRMNETLEAMAQAIFKDWFVDFGPTRAKVGRRDPYLSSEFWDLFPDSISGNGLPKGWNSGILADIAESPNRSVSPTDVQKETPYIGLEHMPRRSISLGEWGCAGTVTSNKLIFKKYEILFGKLRPYFHKVGRAPVDGICSTDIVVVKPKGLSWDAFTLQYLSSDEFVNYTSQVSTGTKMPRTSWKLMGQYQITQPPEQIANSFQTLVNPMISRMDRNSTETRYLATIRDILLPKLMSGEIRIHDAVKIVDTAES